MDSTLDLNYASVKLMARALNSTYTGYQEHLGPCVSTLVSHKQAQADQWTLHIEMRRPTVGRHSQAYCRFNETRTSIKNIKLTDKPQLRSSTGLSQRESSRNSLHLQTWPAAEAAEEL